MNVYRTPDALAASEGTVVTIGSFDGVHQGHRRIFSRVNALAQELGAQSLVLTFEPHPRIALNKDPEKLRLLTLLPEKLLLLERYRIANTYVAHFDQAFAAMPGEAFVEHILVGLLQAKAVVIGHDHRFGNARDGGIDMLMTMGERFGFLVEQIDPVLEAEITVSSTKIREALLAGDVQKATTLLGHPYVIAAEVVHGDKLGRTLGYPTANLGIEAPYKLLPEDGVYMARCTLANGHAYSALLSIGTRPTVSGTDRRVEAFLLDYTGDIYGQVLVCEVLAFIRSQLKFDGLAPLMAQMQADEALAREFFASPLGGSGC